MKKIIIPTPSEDNTIEIGKVKSHNRVVVKNSSNYIFAFVCEDEKKGFFTSDFAGKRSGVYYTGLEDLMLDYKHNTFHLIE